MNDTSEKIEQKMIELIKNKTGPERFEMGCSMYDFSKQLMIRGLLEKDPWLSEADLREKLFLSFYGDEFDSNRKAKIICFLRNKVKTLKR
jgi:hypothetical protein